MGFGNTKGATDGVKVMGGFAIGLVSLAIISVMGIAVLVGFKTSGTMDLQGNATIDAFILGIAVFGTFATVMALALVGKIIINLMKQ